jgi:DNA repair protein RecN (Recombination protein N)
MLKSLLIKNYALIEHLEMKPAGDLNIITGETGAGKSIMLGAVGLLLGNRADTKVMFNAKEKCIVEGEFDLSAYDLQRVFDQEELDYEAITLFRREISPGGKSRAFINDTPVTLDTLKGIGRYLIDVHSQHDTLLLGANAYQLQVVDGYARNKMESEVYHVKFTEWKARKSAFEALQEESDRANQESDYQAYLLDELVKADFKVGEQEEMEAQLQVLENAEEIKSKFHQAMAVLGQSEISALPLLGEGTQAMQSLGKYSDSYKELHQRLQSVVIEVKDILQEVERAEELVEFDPDRTEQLKNRLSLLYSLLQKHRGADLKELLEIQRGLSDKVGRVVQMEELLAKARKEMEQAEQEMLQKAQILSESRKSVAKSLVTELEALLKGLGIPNAGIEVRFDQVPPHARGTDEVSLLFSANKGVAPQELKQAASGGEFSRLMFAIKYILADKMALPTIIFDEIDTGVSGEIALKLGRMMQTMAKGHQVISISHLPQVAARGSKHYHVYKDHSSAFSVSKIRELSEQERVEEIARMIGGDRPSAVTFESARELLAES